MFLIHTITIRQTSLVPLQFCGCLKNAIMYARCCRGPTVRLLYFCIANFALHFVPQPERISRRRDLMQREFLSASPTRSSLRSQSVTLDDGVTPCLKYDGEAVGVGGLRRRSGAAATVHEGQNGCRGGPVGGDGSHWRNGGGTRGRRRLGHRRLVQGRLQVCCFEVELILC